MQCVYGKGMARDVEVIGSNAPLSAQERQNTWVSLEKAARKVAGGAKALGIPDSESND